ncbi:MAG TPA: DUF6473 family protein [Rhizomicrobium sp.]|nr:DUF6473 family protein [Rhizomicrobium sp.]
MIPVSVETPDDIADQVDQMLEQGDRVAALRYAMKAIEPLLQAPSDALRFEIRDKIFRKFKKLQYQRSDFEIVDYCGFEISEKMPLFRGPKPSDEILAKGDYFCVMGAAQTYGRLVVKPWPNRLSKKIGLPVLNLGRGGVGPQYFENDRLLKLASGARFVVLQAMSGRSVGCSEYPGGRIVFDGNEAVNRLTILRNIWDKDREKAKELVLRWNESYFKLYERLRDLIGRPTILLWVSCRAPDDWSPETLLTSEDMDTGDFPQLVGRELYNKVAEIFPANLEYINSDNVEFPRSRVTGQRCPHLGSNDTKDKVQYYLSSESHRQVALELVPLAKELYQAA